MDELYTVNQLAEALGITPRTLRFYEEARLLTPERQGNNRVYSRRDRARMTLILRGKRLGFSLSEIREYLELYDVGPRQEDQIRLLVERVRLRLAQLEQQRQDLEATVDELRDIESQALDELQRRAIARE